MANPLYSHTVITQDGSHRDLLDAITLVDAKETPFFSMVPKGKAPININFEWPVDKQLAPVDSATIDGTDLAHSNTAANSDFDNAQGDYDVLSSRVQWFREAGLVSKLAQDVQNQAGIPNHYQYAVRKKLLQLKRNIEVTLCADEFTYNSGSDTHTADVVTGSASAANRTRALGKWIDDGNTNIPAAYRTPAASIESSATSANLTEAEVNDVLQSVYEETGSVKTFSLLCGPNLKKRFKDFTQTQFASTNVASAIKVYNQTMDSKKIINTVDIYEGDFGTVELVPSLWLNHDLGFSNTNLGTSAKARGYLLTMDLLEMRFNQMPAVTSLTDNGGGPRFSVDAILGLCVKNPLALGAFKLAS
jgi:hypothetical protein